MTLPLVSIIIPVYQGERFITAAVRSALAQTYRNLEVLVVDDGSADGTWARLQSLHDARLRTFRQPNSGAAAARNLALGQARGEYIAFLDADDLWLPAKIETEINVLLRAPDGVGIAYSWYFAVDDDGRLLNKSQRSDFTGMAYDRLLEGHAFLIPSASMYHKKIFDELGGFPTKRAFHEDYVFSLRASRRFPVFPTREYLVVYKQTMSGKGRRIMRDYDLARRSAISIVDDLGDELSADEREKLRGSQLRGLYMRFLMYGFSTSARRLLPEIDVSALGGGMKGRLGWFFAKTGVNLMMLSRNIVQGLTMTFGQRSWQALLNDAGLVDASHVHTLIEASTLAG